MQDRPTCCSTSDRAASRRTCCGVLPVTTCLSWAKRSVQAESAAAELERTRRDAERARAPAAGGQLQRRIADLEGQLAAADAQIQQLTVRSTLAGRLRLSDAGRLIVRLQKPALCHWMALTLRLSI